MAKIYDMLNELMSKVGQIENRLYNVELSLSGQQEKIKEMLKETELSMMAEIEGSKISTEDSLQKLERRINRRFKDIESDNRSTQAIARLVQDAGLSFKGTRIPYPLQGNAAIEDIKDYY